MRTENHDFQTGWITQSTYPIFVPYQKAPSHIDYGMTGRTPRRLVIMFSTLVNLQDPAWNPETRTLTFTHGYQTLAKRFRLYEGGAARSKTRDTLTALVRFSYVSYDGAPIPVCEKSNLDGGTKTQSITFTEKFTGMLTDVPREFPLEALMVSGHNRGVTDDLIALACFYCEPGRRLIIPLNVLRTLLPLSEILSRRLITQRAINAANRAQSKWRFRLNRDSIGIQSAEKYVQWEDPLVLNAYARRTPNGHKKSGTVFDADPQFYGYDERP